MLMYAGVQCVQGFIFIIILGSPRGKGGEKGICGPLQIRESLRVRMWAMFIWRSLTRGPTRLLPVPELPDVAPSILASWAFLGCDSLFRGGWRPVGEILYFCR